MKNRLLSMLTAICLIISFAAAFPEEILSDLFIVSASAETSDNCFLFNPLGNEYEITKYIGSDTEVIIPSTHMGLPVTSIGERAFAYEKIESITIPESVTSIGARAFSSTKWLKAQQNKNPLVIVNGILIDGTTCTGDITIPNSVTSIGSMAFYKCSELTSITIPDSIRYIDESVFTDCENLTSVVLPDGIIGINDCAFMGCTSLTSITIPNSVTYIGYQAFRGCKSLTSITLPDSIRTIYECAFTNCEKLTSVVLPDGITVVEYGTFGCCGKLNNIKLSNKVTSIESNAFQYCCSLTKIDIPNSVTSIGDGAFRGCTSLTSINIPNGITGINPFVFYECTSLKSINIPDSVLYISVEAFCGCTSLTSITIPDGVIGIYTYAFKGCTSLTSITIPKSVVEITDSYSYSPFIKCDNLTIYGYKGTVAEKHAADNNIKFVALDDKGKTDEAVHNVTIEYQYEEGQYFSSPKLLDYSFKYDDDWIFKPSTTLNGDLARASVGLACSAYQEEQVLNCLEDMGFDDIENHKYGKNYTPTYEDNDHVRAKIGHKMLNGYDIYIVPVKGTSSDCEWFSDFNLGTGDDHKGFYDAAKELETAIYNKFTKDKADSSKTIILLTGHSRGAAVANIVAGHLTKGTIAGKKYKIPQKQVFGYTFACPSVSKNADDKLQNIYNFNNPGDIVPAVPPSYSEANWGFKRFGITKTLDTSSNTFELFMHGIYNRTGNTYQGALDTQGFIKALIALAPNQDSYNSKKNKAVFDVIAWNMLKKEEKEKYRNEVFANNFAGICLVLYSGVYKLNIINQSSSVTKLLGMYIVDLNSNLNVSTTVGHGHTGTTYIEWVNAMYSSSLQSPVHKYVSTVYPSTKTQKGYTLHKCNICGNSYKDNYTPIDVIVDLKKNITNCLISLSKSTYTYTGEACKPSVLIKNGSVILKSGTDYTVTYKNNTKVGTATVTITGKGNYTGTVKKTFQINLANVTGFKNVAVSANAIKFTWNKTPGADGYVVYLYNKSAKQWKRYAKTTGGNNVQLVNKLNSGEAYALTARAYKTVNGREVLSPSFNNYKTSTNPAKVSFSVTSKSKGAATYSWSKVTGATSYALYYKSSANASWTRVATVNNSTTSYIKTGLKSDTGYFTVRAFRTYEGKTYGSAFDTKTVKVK